MDYRRTEEHKVRYVPGPPVIYQCRGGGKEADELARKMMGKTIQKMIEEDERIVAIEVRVIRKKKK